LLRYRGTVSLTELMVVGCKCVVVGFVEGQGDAVAGDRRRAGHVGVEGVCGLLDRMRFTSEVHGGV
jgi:hypothetical protein